VIERLDPNDTRPSVLIDKMNEIIDGLNETTDALSGHTHVTTESQTSGPIIYRTAEGDAEE
jgi:hypothetical protein